MPQQATVFDDIADEPKKKTGTVFDDIPDVERRQIDFSKPAEPSNLQQLGQMANDAFQGVGSGVASTGVGLYDLARKIPGADKVLPMVHPSIRAATAPPDSTAGRLGKAAEQVGEFFLPAGMIGRGTKAIESATAGSKAAPLINTLGRAGLETAGATGVTAAQTGGDPESMKTAAKTAGLVNTAIGVPMAAARMIPPVNAAMNEMGRKMYAGALKIPPGGSFSLPEREDMITMGINRVKALPNRSGYKKINSAIQGIEDTVNPAVAQGAARGDTVQPSVVGKVIGDTADKFDTVNPQAHRDAIDSVKNRFMDEHTNQAPFTKIQPVYPYGGGPPVGYSGVGSGVTKTEVPIPLDRAQKIKRDTYRDLSDTAFGTQATSTTEALKSGARGLKEEVYGKIHDLVPNIDKLGQDEKVLIDLREAFERFLAREGNKQVVPLTAAAALHDPGVAMAIKFFDNNPALKGRLAIALANRGQDPGAFLRNVKRLGPPAMVYGTSQQQDQQQ